MSEESAANPESSTTPGPAADPVPASGPMTAAKAAPANSAAVRYIDEDGEPFDVEAFFDPDYGPPEGADAWLARVASPVADEYLAAHQPPAGAREALAAGFTHRDREPGARGWAAGGALDVMEPGPVLAGFADDAITDGLPALTDDELIGVLGAARRLASRAASVELAVVTDLSARREAYADRTRDRRQVEHVSDEIAAALTLTCRAADRLLTLAAGVTRLPTVTAALAAGRIDLPRANIYALELAGLADESAAAIAALTISDAPGLTTGELGAVLRRLVLAHDPDAARKKRTRAQKDARVETWAENAGTAALAGRDLPPADVLAADKNIDYYARQLKKAGTPGTLEFLRARVFTALLTSRPLYTLLPGNDNNPDNEDDRRGNGDKHGSGGADKNSGADRNGRPGGNPDCPAGGTDGPAGSASWPADSASSASHGDDDRPGEEEDSGEGNGGGPRRPGPGTGPPSSWPPAGTGTGLRPSLGGSVNLTIPLSAWLGLTSHPGEAPGFGPLDADTSRDLASRIAATPGSQWCLTILSPDGRAIGHGCARSRAGPPSHGTPPSPGQPPPGTGPSGTGPPGTGPPGTGPPGTGPPGTGPPDIAGLPSYDEYNPPGNNPPGENPACADTIRWLAGLKISWLQASPCSHPRETRAYRPSAALRQLIKTRDRTCSYPGCRRNAWQCDDDHTLPHDQGGRTCECNMSPLCRRHHAAKQAPGWHLEHPRPGTLIWTMPNGRTRTVTPPPYPV